MSSEGTPQTKAQKRKAKQRRQEANRAKKKTLFTKVLGDAKLLEKILLHLPLKDLLFAEAVCTSWKTVMEQSSTIQKALFFEPAGSGVVYMHERDKVRELSLANEDFFYFVPSLESSFKVVKDFQYGREMCLYFDQQAKQSETLGNKAEQALHEARLAKYFEQARTAGDELRKIGTRTRVFLNPLLMSKIPAFHHLFTANSPRAINVDLKEDRDLPPAARRPEASWRRQLLTQPPLAVLPLYKQLIDMTNSKVRAIAAEEWNALGREHWTIPIRMVVVRKRMAEWRMFQVKIRRGDLFETWKDGTDLVKAEDAQKSLLYDDRVTKFLAKRDKADGKTSSLEDLSSEGQEAAGGGAGTLRRVIVPPGGTLPLV